MSTLEIIVWAIAAVAFVLTAITWLCIRRSPTYPQSYDPPAFAERLFEPSAHETSQQLPPGKHHGYRHTTATSRGQATKQETSTPQALAAGFRGNR